MKLLTGALIAALAIVGGGARMQDVPAVHQHEHAQPPAVAEQKAGEQTEHNGMCACCTKDGGMAGMQEKMKEMMGKMKDTAKENK